MRLNQTTFVVVDVETTGLKPNGLDRVIEIAVIRMDASGKRLGTYETLLNPDRGVGRTDIHRIRPEDVADAPRFEQVVGDVLEQLRGAVFVAHNVPFDLGFVFAELKRAGVANPTLPSLCTLQLSRRVYSRLASHSLGAICTHLGIQLRHAHSAMADAEATADVLLRCLSEKRRNGSTALSAIGVKNVGCLEHAWPTIPPSGVSHPRMSV